MTFPGRQTAGHRKDANPRGVAVLLCSFSDDPPGQTRALDTPVPAPGSPQARLAPATEASWANAFARVWVTGDTSALHGRIFIVHVASHMRQLRYECRKREPGTNSSGTNKQVHSMNAQWHDDGVNGNNGDGVNDDDGNMSPFLKMDERFPGTPERNDSARTKQPPTTRRAPVQLHLLAPASERPPRCFEKRTCADTRVCLCRWTTPNNPTAWCHRLHHQRLRQSTSAVAPNAQPPAAGTTTPRWCQ